MYKKISGLTRSKASKRPNFLSPEPRFYICNECGNIITSILSEKSNSSYVCCNHDMTELIPNSSNGCPYEHLPKYSIIGGYENSVITVDIGEKRHPMVEEHHIEWIYLYTFQGGQIKYLKPSMQPSAIFALADDDAYVYCDSEVCEECFFKCKRGFTIFAYCNIHGLWKVTL